MANKRKTTTAIVAGVTALALVLGGTFAWTSISQQARNEAIVDINPGGRLHDDFNGTNKDVYVENFSSGATGVPIYARIRLDQYMEIGQQAGLKKTEGKKATPIISEDNIDQPEYWETYIPGEDNVIDPDNPFFKYWKWDLGNGEDDMPYYMPTFNKDKDSLKADINGTYEGTVEGDKVHYDNYKVYGEGEKVTADATYDWDDDTVEEENPSVRFNANDPWDSADIYKESEEHTAAKITSTADVILMKDWLAMSADERKACKAWVYDEDGWAYWSQAIQPGETTGLLLTGINQIRVPDDSWYYGINVVGQFVTSSDLTAFEADGKLSDGAKELLGFAAEIEAGLSVSGPTAVQPGKTYNYTASMTKAGMAVAAPETLAWSVEDVKLAPAEDGTQTTADDVITIANDGTLTIAETVTFGTTFTVKATADGVTDSIAVTVVDSWQSQVDALTPGTTATVEIDGIEWFVLAKENGKALLLSSESVKTFEQWAYEGGDLEWGDYDAAWTAGGYRPTTPTVFFESDEFSNMIPSLKESLVSTTLYTETCDWNDYANTYRTFIHSVYLASAEDFVGSVQYSVEAWGQGEMTSSIDKYYTHGTNPLISQEMVDIMMKSATSGKISTRSCYGAWDNYCIANEGGVATEKQNGMSGGDIFPMMWVKYDMTKMETIPILIKDINTILDEGTVLVPEFNRYNLTAGKRYAGTTIEFAVDEAHAQYITLRDYNDEVGRKYLTIAENYPDFDYFTITVTEKDSDGKVVAEGSLRIRAASNVQPLTFTPIGFEYTEGMEMKVGQEYQFRFSGKNYPENVSLWFLGTDCSGGVWKEDDAATGDTILHILPKEEHIDESYMVEVIELGRQFTEWELHRFTQTDIKFKVVAAE